MDEYPLRMKPVFKDYIWGGNTLKKLYKKDSPYKITAESWEVADHADGKSVVVGGSYDGKTLSELVKEFGKDFVGELCECENDEFPLMLKIIDAKDSLSVQVHPDDAYAAEQGGNCQAKTEMWYILDAEAKSDLVYGFNKDITTEEFATSIKNGTLIDNLNFVPAEEGDAFFIEGGTVHAIGKGLLIAEIQQNSNTTYRVYDWDRVGADGKPRQLHVQQALEVSLTDSSVGNEKMPALTVETEDYKRTFIACCKYFATEKVQTEEFSTEETDGRSFHIILFTKKEAEIECESGAFEAQAGDAFVIPASLGEYKINGECEYLKFYVPEFEQDILSPLAEAGYAENEILSLLK